MAAEAAAQPASRPMSDAQARFIRNLAQGVVGDGEKYLRDMHARNGGSTTTSQASGEIAALTKLKDGARPMVQTRQGVTTTTAPPGRYAVEDPDKGTVLVEVSKPAEGRWAGYTFVKTIPLVPGAESEPVRGLEARKVLNSIESEPVVCASNYGRITQRCGQCNKPLSDPQSLKIGLGPECRSNFD